MGNEALDERVRQYLHHIAENPTRTTVAAKTTSEEVDASPSAVGLAIPRVARDNPEIGLKRVTSTGSIARWEVTVDE